MSEKESKPLIRDSGQYLFVWLHYPQYLKRKIKAVYPKTENIHDCVFNGIILPHRADNGESIKPLLIMWSRVNFSRKLTKKTHPDYLVPLFIWSHSTTPVMQQVICTKSRQKWWSSRNEKIVYVNYFIYFYRIKDIIESYMSLVE